MMVRVIQEFLESKLGEPNGGEDRSIKGSRFYGVADGATDYFNLNWGTFLKPLKGGYLLADIVKQTLESDEVENISYNNLVNLLNQRIHEAAWRANIDLNERKNRANCSFAVYDSNEHMMVYVGDCSFAFERNGRIIKEFDNNKVIDEANANLRARKIEELRKKGINPFVDGRDLGREYILPILESQDLLQNDGFGSNKPFMTNFLGKNSKINDYAYKSINGFPVSLDTMKIPMWVDSIILTTDGYRVVKSNLSETEKTLQEMLDKDPHCINELRATKGLNPGQTSYDDRAYMKIDLR